MKKKFNNIVSSFTKVGLYLLFIIGVCFSSSNIIKQFINQEIIYTTVASLGDVDNGVVLLDYQVFGSEKKFEENLMLKPLEKLEELKQTGEIMMVRIYGEEYNKVFKDDYWLVEDPEAIELNIEYYIIKNIKIGNTVLPTITMYNLINDLLIKFNNIAKITIVLLSFGICIPFIIGTSNHVYYIYSYFKTRKRILED